MSKLLSDEELAKYLADQEGYSNPNNLHTQALVKFVNTQKRLYAEMVVGEYFESPDGYPTESNFIRNELIQEQKARIK